MTDPTETLSNRTIAGRVVGGIWAVNFLLMTTDTFTFNGQSTISIGLAISAVVLLFRR